MANAKPKYFLVEATALPEVFVKVTEATLTYVAITQQGVKRELPELHKS